MGRSKSVTELIKIRRDNIYRNDVQVILGHDMPVYSGIVRARIARNLARMQERDDRWIALASDVYGLPKDAVGRHVTLGGDSTLLAIVIDTCRRYLDSNKCDEKFI